MANLGRQGGVVLFGAKLGGRTKALVVDVLLSISLIISVAFVISVGFVVIVFIPYSNIISPLF